MERLTIKFPNGYLFKLPPVNDKKAGEEYISKLSDKLGAYEDAEEQGLLLRLPCKVGDRFWIIAYSQNTRVVEVECVGIEITKTEKKIWIENVLIPRDYWELHFEDFATQYFATKAAAEQALEQMKGGAV